MPKSESLPQMPPPCPPDTHACLPLDALSGKLDHTIMVVEYVQHRVETFDDSISDLKKIGEALQRTSMTIASAALKIHQSVNPIPMRKRVMVMMTGSFLGGFLAQGVFILLTRLFS